MFRFVVCSCGCIVVRCLVGSLAGRVILLCSKLSACLSSSFLLFLSSCFSHFFSSSLVVYSLFLLFIFFSFDAFLNSIFDTFRCLWGPFFSVLGPLLVPFGASWGLFWASWGLLERCRTPHGVILGFEGAKECAGSMMTTALGSILTNFWVPFGCHFGYI